LKVKVTFELTLKWQCCKVFCSLLIGFPSGKLVLILLRTRMWEFLEPAIIWILGCFLLLIYLIYYVVYCLLFTFLNFYILFVCLTFLFCLFCLFVYLFTSCKWLAEGRGPRTHQTSESAHWRCNRLDYGHCWGTTGVYCQGKGRKNITTAEKGRSIWLLISLYLIVTIYDWKLLILQTAQ